VFFANKILHLETANGFDEIQEGSNASTRKKIMDPQLKKLTSPATHITSNIQQTNIFL
jgi:hypothetical protein